MMKLIRLIKDQRGFMQIFYLVIVAVIAVAVIQVTGSANVATAITTLESRGYVVLSAGEYASLSTRIDALKVSADAAVVAAQAAVVQAQAAAANASVAATKVDLFNSAEVHLFPATTNLTCTLTAGNTNQWGAWAEVADNGTNTLSSVFAANPGYVSDMLFFLPSDAADGYSVELAYGAAKNILGRVAVWALAGGDIAYVLPIKSRYIPAGETIYYRMQCTGANGATVQARFRYFYE